MQLTIATDDDRIITIEIDEGDSVDTLQAIVEAEIGVKAFSLVHNGAPLVPGASLQSKGVCAGDLIMLINNPIPSRTGATRAPAHASNDPMATNPDGTAANPGLFMEMLRNSPAMAQMPAPLANAIRNNDVESFQNQLRELTEAKRKAEEEEERFMRMAAEDPFNPEVQRRLEEAIQAKNVADNFEQAVEYNPEAFASVTMLYVDMEVNGVPMKAFIDSGAQSTIMSKSTAEKCGILRLLDKRFQGTAVGVGSAKILGRVHMCPFMAGGNHFPVSITVLEQEGMDFLFGLDNLKRHQCSIDLKANVLRFGSTETSLPFLAEHQIPKSEIFRSADSPQPSQEQQQPPGSGIVGGGGPSTAAAAPNTTAPSGGALPDGWDAKVERLMALGFTREQCIGALRATNGNEEVAGSMLFSF